MFLEFTQMIQYQSFTDRIRLLAVLSFVMVFASDIRGQDYSRVPGVVLSSQLPPPAKIYISSPSFVVMPDGGYAAAHDLFGKNSNDFVSGTTKVFYSRDQGATWTAQSVVADMHQASLFFHDALYLFGYTKGSGNVAIRKSTDNGVTWTTPSDAKTGLLKVGRYGGTPSSAVLHDNRIWIGANTSAMSAGVGSDLLDAASWSSCKPLRQDPQWLGASWTFWSEGQIVASPQTGVVLLPKSDGLPFVGLLRAASPDAFSFNPDADFAAVPGAEKKFGAKYDPISKRFYILSNPVLPAHFGRIKPQLARTTAAMLASKDLRHWDVEKIFLFTPNLDDGTWGEAFQYFSFDFDGDDLALVSRTSFSIGGYKPPRGHDSNLLTFHKIKNFRTAAPDHFLIVDAEHDSVLRFESTQHEDAPLGDFALGRRFDGKPLRRPESLAQDVNGDVYIIEKGGRTLRFDALGNFIAAASTPPSLGWQKKRLQLALPPASERVWVRTTAGDWDAPMNWFYWGRPDTSDEVAVFGSAIDDDCRVRLNQPLTIKGMRFRSAAKYALEGRGGITFESSTGDCRIDVQRGRHECRVDIRLSSNTVFHAEEKAELQISGGLDLNGKTLRVCGSGRIYAGSRFAMGGGVLALDGSAPFSFDSDSPSVLDGVLKFQPVEGVELAAGQRYQLLEGLDHLGEDTFAAVQLPELNPGLAWDTARLYSEGIVRIVAKP
jgi:hypothetical protein